MSFVVVFSIHGCDLCSLIHRIKHNACRGTRGGLLTLNHRKSVLLQPYYARPMKITFFIILAVLLGVNTASAQNGNTDLLAQSPDGKTVKLVWFLNSVPSDITGFDIKRKDGLGEWHKLNTDPILPGISQKKNLTTAEPDNTEASRIREKLKDMVHTGKLHEYDYATFIQKWKNNDKEIQDVILLAALDFDVSVMCGFGFVDRSVTQKMDYQYGLFLQGTDKLLEKVSWSYGEIPDLNVVHGITSMSMPGKKGVKLIWNADVNKMKGSYVAGFNVYKRGIRLNDQPISMHSAGDRSEFSWNDAAANAAIPDQYSISAESLFGIEGIIRSYTYDPEDHPSEYKKAVVTRIVSLGFYFKDGISVDWTFPKEYERFIKGFYIEKDNMPEGYKRVSDLVSPEARSFVDKTGSPVSSYTRIRVSALYNDKNVISGVEKLYSYFQMIDPPKPQSTRVGGVVEGKKYNMKISWEPMMSGDSLTHHYKIYMFDNESNRFISIADKLPIKTTSYTHVIQPSTGGTYKFCVTGVSRTNVESVPGDTVIIQVPSLDPPVPVTSKFMPEVSKVTIQWQYPEVPDLAGFRVYIDGSLIADEKILKKSSREFTKTDLQPGTVNSFTVRAVSDRGVTSEPSAPLVVTNSAGKK